MPWDQGRPKGNTTARGYGHEHAKARAEAAKTHRPDDLCTRCHRPLGPMGSWLHYDHTDRRDGYLGFAHAECNRTAGASAGARKSNARRRWTRPAATQPTLRRSERW